MTILVVDDEESLVVGLKKSLRREGFTVLSAPDGEACLKTLADNAVDLVVLDLMLPRMDGMTVCRRIREKRDTPIIMLTARDDVIDRVMGLESGADDYLVKPFHTRELIARIRSILRRAAGPTRDPEVVTVGPVTLDRARRRVSRSGAPVELTAREFDIVMTLMSRPGVVFSREQLFESVWGDRYVDSRSIDVHVSRLREKLEDDPSRPTFLRTRWGAGYYVSDDAL